MLEHVFRNINDIRVFDIFYVDGSNGETFDVDGILKMLEYGDAERIQVRDSVEHLVKMKAIEVVEEDAVSESGCKTCLYLDRLKIPRFGEHKSHIAYKEAIVKLPAYRIAVNDFTEHLFKALFVNIQMVAEEN